MEIVKKIWSKFLLLKWWAKIIVVLLLLSGFGALTGSNTESTSSSNNSSQSASGESTPSAEASLSAEEKSAMERAAAAELQKSLSSMRVQKDSVTNKKWYYAKSTTKYLDVNSFHLYIGQDQGSEPYLRMRIQYTGDDWLFINKYTINADGRIFTLNPSYGDVERDNDSNVWEWYDASPTSEELEMIKAIAKSKKTVIRPEGDQYYRDRTITGTEKTALSNVMNAYYALLKQARAA